jgi:alpha-glucosidase
MDAPLSHINVHVRDGAAILLHTTPAYTIEETRKSDYSLLVHLTPNGTASGTAYLDDGESQPPTPFRDVEFEASSGQLVIRSVGDYHATNKLAEITVLMNGKSADDVSSVRVNGKDLESWTWDKLKGELVVRELAIDLNEDTSIIYWG